MNLLCMNQRLKFDLLELELCMSRSKSRQWAAYGVTSCISLMNRYWSISDVRSITSYWCAFSNINGTLLEGRSLNNGRQIIKD